MRIAVMSDIHGYNLALETVLRDLDEQGPFDEVVVAGDLCVAGPGPREALDLLRARDWTVLQGNGDAEVAEAGERGRVSATVRYVIEQIGPDGVKYLAALPFSRRITPPGGESPADDLLVVHANPHNVRDKFRPEMSDRELRQVMGDIAAAAIAFGHHHICYTREVDGTLLVDVSAVGNPRDGDLRCKYGVLTWDGETRRWSAELRKLPYPLAETESQIMSSSLSHREEVLRYLLRASY
ncbi:MAG: metallophosphoesterase family protein [Thermomicrobiales bacterium]